MNIMHVVFSLNNGGIEHLIIDILNKWHFEYDNVFLCIVNNNYDPLLIDKLNIASNRIIKLERPIHGKKIKYVIELNSIIKKFGIEILHCHSNQAVRLSILAKMMSPKLKLVYTVHATSTYSNMSKADVIIHNLLLYKIIAISKAVKKEIVNKNRAMEIEIVYNGIDISKFSGKKNRDKTKRRIVCVARLEPPIKGQDILLYALGELRKIRDDFECLLIGAPPVEENDYLNELKKQVQELNLEKQVIFYGNCNHVPSLLETADILVLPSREEGFGIAILEGLISRTPVIASNIDGPKEIIGDDEYGILFEKGNYLDLMNKINSMIDSDNKELVEKAYKYGNENYSIEGVVNKLRSLYI